MKKKTKKITLVEKNAALLAKKNAAFNKLTKPQKRVQIAKDVLAQLKIGFLKAKTGVYTDSKSLDRIFQKINNTYDLDQSNLSNLLNVEVKDIFDKDKSCTVCGIGSLFVCAVKRLDKLKLKDLFNDADIAQSDVHSYLSKYFSLLQLNLIESAFEGGEFLNSPYYDNIKAVSQSEKAVSYFDGQRINSTEKLKAIMNNIVENNGTFKV